MKKRKFTTALWSLDSDVGKGQDEVLGNLKFDGNSPLELEIPAGILLDRPKIPIEGGYKQVHSVEGVHADQVYGFSQRGEYYLLRDVSSPGPGMSIPGMPHQNLIGTSLFVSREPLVANPIVKCISLRIPGLREWLGIIPFKVIEQLGEYDKIDITFNFNSEDAKAFILYEDDEIEISIDPINTRKGGPIPSFSFEFETDCKLKIKVKREGIEFDSFMQEKVYNIVNFLAFCMGFKYQIDVLKIETVEGIKAEYFAPFVGASGIPSSTQLRSMPFPYTKIKEKIETMISCWYGFDDYLRNSSTLLTSLMNKWNMPLDMVFLASAQAFEAASRSNIDEYEISQEDFNEHLNEVKASNLKAKLKKWLLYKLQYANWKSADRLAKELICKLDYFATYVVPDSSRFLDDHRKHRDAYTHRRSLGEEENLSTQDLYSQMEAVQLLTYGAIALYIGLEPDEILNRFKDSGYRSNSLYRARKLYALA